MGRNTRAELARQTLAALDAGEYTAPDGARVSIRAALDACLAGTRLHEPDELARMAATQRARPGGAPARIEVVNETTLEGIARLHADGVTGIAALNFASARQPGGGFQGGSQAQEESLARSSGLYPSLMRAWPYYERHRAASSLLYSDAIIFSPACPVLRDDAGAWLPAPRLAHFITCAAPNAGAVFENQPEDAPRIPAVLTQRAECVLALAASLGLRTLVLGAWGCGVFRNDAATVADIFRGLLVDAGWRRHFERVRFSVYDGAVPARTFDAFMKALGGARPE